MVFKKSEWLIKADEDIKNGYLTEQEKEDALEIWVNDADGKTYAELGWDEEQMQQQAELEKARKQAEAEALAEQEKQQRKAEIKIRLNQLSEDIVQHEAGEIVPDYPQRLEEFRTLHNELRVLEGKEPRQKQIQL